MLDLNYFTDWPLYLYFVIFFSLIVLLFLEKRTIIGKIKYFFIYSIIYFLIISIFIWLTYYPKLVNNYYKKSLYKETVFSYKKYKKSNKIKKWFERLILSKEKKVELENKFILSLYISRNYSDAISYLEKKYKKSKKNSKNKDIFWGLYLAHSYMEIGDIKKGRNIYYKVEIKAISVLSENELILFRQRVKLTIEKFVNF